MTGKGDEKKPQRSEELQKLTLCTVQNLINLDVCRSITKLMITHAIQKQENGE
jgi:hypothetical protein